MTTFCAPPTVWRMLVQADLGAWELPALREVVGAGEPLNPEVIDARASGCGASRSVTASARPRRRCRSATRPASRVMAGSMGRPLPGFDVVLVDPVSGERGRDEGEICLDLDGPHGRPVGLMTGYRRDGEHADDEAMATAMAGGVYHTGDVATRDADGYITFVGRTDDVFKASDYRISPFELESVLIEHPAVAEAAIVPAPDPVRLRCRRPTSCSPRATSRRAELACAILAHARDEPRAVQADPPAGVRRPAQDDLRQDPPGRAAARPRTERGDTRPRGGVPRGRLPLGRGLPALADRSAGSRPGQIPRDDLGALVEQVADPAQGVQDLDAERAVGGAGRAPRAGGCWSTAAPGDRPG